MFEQPENLNVRRKPVLQMFSRGDIDNFKLLTVVHIVLAYINNLAAIRPSFRYLLKKEPFNAVEFAYHPWGIELKFQILDEAVEDPSQLPLFPAEPDAEEQGSV